MEIETTASSALVRNQDSDAVDEKTRFIYLLNKCTMLFIHLDKDTKKDVLGSIRDFIQKLQGSFQEQEHLQLLSVDEKKERILQVLIPYLQRLTANFMIEHIQVDDARRQYLVREIDISSLQYAKKMLSQKAAAVAVATAVATAETVPVATEPQAAVEPVVDDSPLQGSLQPSAPLRGARKVEKEKTSAEEAEVKTIITENMSKMTRIVQEKMSHMEVEIRRYFESQFSKILDSNQEELQGKKEHIQSMIAEIHGKLQSHLEHKMAENMDQNYEVYLNTNYEKMRDEIRDNMEYQFRLHLQDEMNQKVERLTHILNKNLEASLRENTDLLREEIHAFISQKIREYDCAVSASASAPAPSQKLVFDKSERVLRLLQDGQEICSTKIEIEERRAPAPVPQKVRSLPPVLSNLDITKDGYLTMMVEDENGSYPLRSLHQIPVPQPPPAAAAAATAATAPARHTTTTITKNVHDLFFQKEYVMRLDEENDKTLVVLKSLSVGEGSHCMKHNAVAVGGATCFQENSLAIGPQSQTLARNSVALFGSTAGQNAFAFGAENVTQNVFQVGSKENYNMEKIVLCAREVEIKSDEIRIRAYEEKMRALEEKIAQLERKIR